MIACTLSRGRECIRTATGERRPCDFSWRTSPSKWTGPNQLGHTHDTISSVSGKMTNWVTLTSWDTHKLLRYCHKLLRYCLKLLKHCHKLLKYCHKLLRYWRKKPCNLSTIRSELCFSFSERLCKEWQNLVCMNVTSIEVVYLFFCLKCFNLTGTECTLTKCLPIFCCCFISVFNSYFPFSIPPCKLIQISV